MNSDHVLVQLVNNLPCLYTKILLSFGHDKIFVMMGFLYVA